MTFHPIQLLSSAVLAVAAGATQAPLEFAQFHAWGGDHGYHLCEFTARLATPGGQAADAYQLMISVTRPAEHGVIRLRVPGTWPVAFPPAPRTLAAPTLDRKAQLTISADGVRLLDAALAADSSAPAPEPGAGLRYADTISGPAAIALLRDLLERRSLTIGVAAAGRTTQFQLAAHYDAPLIDRVGVCLHQLATEKEIDSVDF